MDFFSGGGSHDPEVVEPYVHRVREFLASLEQPLTVIDLGCGDFNVGNRLTDLAGTYIACDVVGPLIERNQRLFVKNSLEFRQLDAIVHPLPQGDVVIVKQVFQHLRNDQIAAILGKMKQFNAWIICEHLPATQDFTPNIDHRAGPDNRLGRNSGIVVTAPPFNVTPRKETILCETPSDRGIIRTVAYQFCHRRQLESRIINIAFRHARSEHKVGARYGPPRIFLETRYRELHIARSMRSRSVLLRTLMSGYRSNISMISSSPGITLSTRNFIGISVMGILA